MTMTGPLAAGDTMRSNDGPIGSAGGRAGVLIVDDNDINRKVLTGMLRKEACTLYTAADGERALQLAREHQPDLVLLDIMMPGKDGYQVCAELKADPATMHLPVIFLSALSETADKIRGLELGAVDYITKPFDHGEVLARVRSQLKIQALANALRAANRDLEEKQAHIDEDLRAAGAIQRSLMPAAPPPIAEVDLAWRFMPCERVGGDLFNFCPLPDRHLALHMFDVSGHGVPAALVSVSLSQFLSPQANRLTRRAAPGAADRVVTPPAEILAQLDREYPIERFDKYFTIAYLVLDYRTGALRYSTAGHPMPVLLRADGRLELLDAGGPIIGLDGRVPFDEGEVALAPGDRLFLYTDGIVELANAAGELFGEERLYAALGAARGLALEAACDRVTESLEAFGAGVGPQDDVTFLAVEYRGASR